MYQTTMLYAGNSLKIITPFAGHPLQAVAPFRSKPIENVTPLAGHSMDTVSVGTDACSKEKEM